MTNAALREANEIDAQVGERIHTIMWRRRMSQAALAESIGITQSTLSKKLRGTVPMSVFELVSISVVLGVPADSLLPRLDSNQEPSGYTFAQVRALCGGPDYAHHD
jgi:transcriptional regulator with XRE-family HTH domain